MIIIDTLVIILLFAVFGFSHSLLASKKLKEKLAEALGDRLAFYRLFYNVSSLLLLILIYDISPKPNVLIYDLNPPFDLIAVSIQILGVAGFIWAVTQIDSKEFLGISQVMRFFNKTYNPAELDERMTLVTKGPFRFSRHPIYFFSIIILSARASMDLFYLVFLISIISYFIIGSIFEEKKLLSIFGVKYEEYKKSVPRIVPFTKW